MYNYGERSFGVEIECDSNGFGISGTQNLLEKNGLGDWGKGIVHDGSEIEIKSPILSGSSGLNELKNVMNLLKENGYSTFEEDGMHCHFDAQDLDEEDIKRVIFSWDANKDVVQKFLGSDRFNNAHCTYDYNFNSLLNPTDSYYGETVWDYDGQKCYAIEPRQRLGTIEFRQHFGTLEFDDARAWILLVQAFIKTVKNMDAPMKTVSMDKLFEMTRTYKVAQRNLTTRSFNTWGERVYS